MTERIVEIYAEYPSGPRLAFVGFLTQAAYRQDMTKDALVRAIALNLPLTQTPLADRQLVSPKDWRGTLLYPSWPAATNYYAKWRK